MSNSSSAADLQERNKSVDEHEMAEPDEDDYWPLTGKPYFSMVFMESHIERKGGQMNLPTKVQTMLPRSTVPVILTYRRNTWNMTYIGNSGRQRFDRNWFNFVDDNDLKIGDACVFELTECSDTAQFKVQILRSNFPAELKAREHGWSADDPLVIP